MVLSGLANGSVTRISDLSFYEANALWEAFLKTPALLVCDLSNHSDFSFTCAAQNFRIDWIKCTI